MAVPEVTVLIAGKSGAGKSQLFKNLLNEDAEDSAQVQETGSIMEDGLRINLIDFPSLTDSFKLSSEVKFDILLFCIPIRPGSRFLDGNPLAMKWLHDHNKDIWKRCILIFTFSDRAWDHISSSNPEDPQQVYSDHVDKCAALFQAEMKGNIPVFSWGAGDNIYDRILAIPTGFSLDDPVLPGTKSCSKTWREEIFLEISRKYKENRPPMILRPSNVKAILKGAVIGGVVAGVAVGGPIGGVVGGVVGVVVGGGAATAVGAGIGAFAGSMKCKMRK